MVELKCKMCGGNLKIIDKISYTTCEYCGSTMTLPNLNDDRIVNLFNRANQYRLQNEFDKAMATYENILAEDNSNAEAHWGVILAKYGIEYVEDPNTHNRVPTCHRVQYESILSDLDYKEAIKNAQDNKAKTLYEKEATQIAEIQKNILAVARNEKPYDIFICYKETDNNGQRTKDSVFAQDIYNQLVQAKYNVFFSRITLEDKLGTEYEPYIFSALNSAKVMLVIGTTKENFEAVWVKNEWSRFLELLRKDKNRVLIPCYRDMVAYDLPDELSLFQAQDMSKIGFMQDLIYGISKIIEQTPKEQNSNVITINDINNRQLKFENILINARKAVDDKNWENVEKYYNLLQDEFPKNIIIEATFFSNIAKIMCDGSNSNIEELYKSFDTIQKYYDISSENKEEILKKISDFLFKMAFPKGDLSLISYKVRFYNAIVLFNEKLEQLSVTHNETYINDLISKHKQVMKTIELKNEKMKKYTEIKNEKIQKYYEEEKEQKRINLEKEIEQRRINLENKRKKIKKLAKTIWGIWLFILTVVIIRARVKGYTSDSIQTDLAVIFVFGILPYLIISGFFKLLNLKNNNK